jgi:hypothetical protein
MPPYSPSAVGKDAVKTAYDAVFAELTFDVKFNIAELVVMGPTWAYVRTNSAGTTGHHSTGKTTAEANHERRPGVGALCIKKFAKRQASSTARHDADRRDRKRRSRAIGTGSNTWPS